ncbi:MAG TPA: hypothetical protein PL011_06195 [Kiritimatiellia bacterium]|nr:hypothetical protein [Kiritimatiellia bacterium]HPJ56982.1 hypothetical protein [Kiritimatiellia bacterium]HRX07491.1 hypothetical protein [Kiritimatiellia bacterium]
MKKTSRTILGVHVAQRTKHTARVQRILTDFGCSIRTRVGLHDAGDGFCSPNGLILLEMVDRAGDLSAALAKVPGVTVKKMSFKE